MRWFGHSKPVSKERLTRRMLELEVEGRWDRGSLYFKCFNLVKNAMGEDLVELREENVTCLNRE